MRWPASEVDLCAESIRKRAGDHMAVYEVCVAKAFSEGFVTDVPSRVRKWWNARPIHFERMLGTNTTM